MAKEGSAGGQSGAVVVVHPFGYHEARQRTSSDLRLNPHLHVVFLDGVYRAQGEHVLFHELPHLRTRDVAEVLTRATVRMAKYLRRRDLLDETDDEALDGLAALAASAASGRTPPAGPSFRRGALPRTGAPLSFDKPLCVALDGFSLHAATRDWPIGPGPARPHGEVRGGAGRGEYPFGYHEARQAPRALVPRPKTGEADAVEQEEKPPPRRGCSYRP